ncbi:Ubiquitin-like domain superfamily [Arabidopsis suecica]|uniref:Ubiquitin-like domain superfamily n=1 Tax=Arabidopsis suecica TaxID=45249 RepID=A0A8T1Y1I9_ARASU|nr:Ubiquitin-like domain superfamily [Arabidopsis suecica]
MADNDASPSQRELIVKWTDKVSRTFIELLLAQLDKENWVEKSLTREGKLSVRKSFKEATGFDLVWKNFANHLHNLKLWYDCYRRLRKFTGISVDHSTGIITMDQEWWDARIQEQDVAKRFRKRGLANEDLLERLFSGGHIGVEDGWSVGNGRDVYRPQHTYDTRGQFDMNTTYVGEDSYVPLSTPPDEQNQNNQSTQGTINPPSDERSHSEQRGKRKRGASNIDNQSDLSKAFRERSDAIKLAAAEMSSALTSDVTMAARRMHQISEIEFGSTFYWDANKLLSNDEIVQLFWQMVEDGDEDDSKLIDEYTITNMVKQPLCAHPNRGRQFVEELIHGHPDQCHFLLRMRPRVFLDLCETIEKKYNMRSSQNVSVRESVAIFLYICGHNATQRSIMRMFGHSQETICRKFHEVLNAMELMAIDTFKPDPTNLTQVHPKLQSDRRYWPYFKGFVGAMDGTHVPAMVSGRDQQRYWNRKSVCSMNILAVSNFDMLFTYIYVGIPGSAHDAKVLSLAMEGDPNFPHPPTGKYYLVDSGYALRRGYLGPYRQTRYHQNQFQNQAPPSNYKEKFNRRHSSLRCVIERTFGVWKGKWRIMQDRARYDIVTTRKLVVATMTLHNFVRKSSIPDPDFDVDWMQNGDLHPTLDDEDEIVEQDVTGSRQYMEGFRDEIAMSLWNTMEIMSTKRRAYGSNDVKIEGKQRKVESESTHVTLKVKGQDEEGVKVFKVRRTVKLQKLMELYTKMRGVEWDTFRFLFEGSRIREYHTPDGLELKDGDEIDAMMQETENAAIEVNRGLLKELEDMGFSMARASWALHHSGNSSLEAAVNWIIDHENDSQFEKMPLVEFNIEIESPNPSDDTAENAQARAKELMEQARKLREEEETKREREREKERIRAGKEMMETKRIAEENERKRNIALRNAEKDEEKKAREKIMLKVNADKLERKRRRGLPTETESASTSVQVSLLDKRIVMSSPSPASKAEEMRECLRSLRRNHKDEDPRITRRAFETLLTIVRNVAKKPDEERYKRIRLTNRLFHERVGRYKEGIEFMELCGFKREEGSEFLSLSSHDADINRLRDAAFQLKSAITNPFFGLLSTEAEEDREK